MNQNEIDKIILESNPNYYADIHKALCNKFEYSDYEAYEILQSENVKLICELFDQYSTETGEEYIKNIDVNLHKHYEDKIAILEKRIQELETSNNTSSSTKDNALKRTKALEDVKKMESLQKSNGAKIKNTGNLKEMIEYLYRETYI